MSDEDGDRGSRHSELDTESVTRLRETLLPPNLKVQYKASWSPGLHITDGRASYLYDADGEGYLDCVNNVAHVGHCHPKVVAAVSAQLAKLNTNTRYLGAGLVDYAQRLTSLMPEELQVVYMVTSGSEANDLALRLIRSASKASAHHIAVLSSAYHGHTLATLGLSPYKFQGRGGFPCPPHIHIIPCPDAYRGLHMDGKTAARKVIQDAAVIGGEIAAFFYEAFPSCAGQVVLPEGFLSDVCTEMRKIGAICVADEVQTGFGRVGAAFWGFETAGEIPEIVTLGKGIGNGFPMGAVVTTRRIAQSFANGMEYFNTGGGCNAACAAGLAVLDVIASEDLQSQALAVGDMLLRELRKLAVHMPHIGDVRGSGLFIGIEMVLDRETKAPAAQVADWVVSACMQCHSVLLSTDGPFENVIKIKPPMSFSHEDAQMLLDVLQTVLTEELPPRLEELLQLDHAVNDARSSAERVLRQLQQAHSPDSRPFPPHPMLSSSTRASPPPHPDSQSPLSSHREENCIRATTGESLRTSRDDDKSRDAQETSCIGPRLLQMNADLIGFGGGLTMGLSIGAIAMLFFMKCGQK